MKEKPGEVLLEFVGGGSFPVQYETSYMNNTYYIRYRSGYLTIEQNDTIEVFEQALCKDSMDGLWTDEETNVYLMLIAKAILENTLSTLRLPNIEETPIHEFYKRGQWPKYVVVDCKMDHEHNDKCPVKAIPSKELDEVSYNRIRQFNEDCRGRHSDK